MYPFGLGRGLSSSLAKAVVFKPASSFSSSVLLPPTLAPSYVSAFPVSAHPSVPQLFNSRFILPHPLKDQRLPQIDPWCTSFAAKTRSCAACFSTSYSMTEPSHGRLHASCYCGNIRVAIEWPNLGPTITVRACGCGFCTKHKAAWTSNPRGHFHLRIADSSRVTQYRLGTNTADFHVCSTCGVVPIVTCVMEGTRYAVVNAHALNDIPVSQLVQTLTDFEGETTENRLARRRRNWTPEGTGNASGI